MMKFLSVMRNELCVCAAMPGIVRYSTITARAAALLLLLLATSADRPAIAQPSQAVVIDCLPPWEANDRYGHPTKIKHPSLSLNGFDCGSNCDIGYGLKQVLEKTYGANQDDQIKAALGNRNGLTGQILVENKNDRATNNGLYRQKPSPSITA